MEKDFKFAVEDIQKIDISEYEDDEFAVAKMGYLSTKPNSHGLKISEKVLRENASTVLNKWLVADMTGIVDAGTHTKEEKIVGRIPKEQDVEFVYDDDGYLRAYVDVVISKIYAKDFCKIFEEENNRAVSVEMRVLSNEDDESLVESFKIVGVTTLGKQIRPSCPDSDITFTRFSEQEADKFFAKVHNNSLTVLKKFVEERKESMAESKTYKIDKSKESVSDTPWGDVDKTALRNKIMEAKNKATLVKSIYMLVEDGWEEAPSERLKFPVMELKGDTFVYNKGGLSSALGYAKKENETAVINKVEKIYEKLGLGKEEDAKMAEIAFAAVNIGDMWGRVFDALRDRYPDGDWGSVYRIDGIYEQDNKKFAIIHRKDEDVKYRLDFSLTEEGLTLADEIVKVELEIVETEEVRKFAEPEDVDKYKKFEDEDDKDPDDDHDDDSDDDDEDFAKKCAEMEKKIEERDNIIMDKDKKIKEMEKELSELREFKKTCMEKEKMSAIESIMSEVKEFMSEDKYKELREEGIACDFAQIDAWSNKVKAFCFESGKKSTKKEMGVFSFAAPIHENEQKKTRSVWERL